MNSPLGFQEDYRKYLDLYAKFGKALNERDMSYGHATWIGMDLESKRAAYRDLSKRFLEARRENKDLKYVPFPSMHLFARSWERVVQSSKELKPCPDCRGCGYVYDAHTTKACRCPIGAIWERDWGHMDWSSL